MLYIKGAVKFKYYPITQQICLQSIWYIKHLFLFFIFNNHTRLYVASFFLLCK